MVKKVTKNGNYALYQKYRGYELYIVAVLGEGTYVHYRGDIYEVRVEGFEIDCWNISYYHKLTSIEMEWLYDT